MVCYGPSKGCKRCRQRKIKCDERRPFCRNCEKSKRECPGYDRGEGAISFKDETQNVTQQQSRHPSPGASQQYHIAASSDPSKPRRRRRSTTQQSVSKHHGSVLISPSPHTNFDMMVVRPDTAPLVVTNEIVPLGLPRDPEQQSLSFFLTNFALLAERTGEIWGGFLETLPTLLEKAPSKSPLAAAASTTALASIAWTPGHKEYRQEALSKYVTSLKRINEALRDPKEAKSDNVLMAVLMLGFYENIKTLTLQRSDREAHVKGAVALIKARKPDSFQSKESLRLFLAVRAQLLSLCIEKCDPAPFEDFKEATQGTIPADYTPSSADRLVMLSEPLPSLLQDQQIMLTTTSPLDQQNLAANLLTSCYQLEETLAYWSTMIPPEFQYTSLPFPNDKPYHEDWYPNSLDVYTDYTMASTWNTWRITRVRVLSIVLSCLNILNHSSPTSSPYEDPSSHRSPEYTSTLTTISTLLNAICSSVPYHLGFHDQRVSPTSPQPTPFDTVNPFDYSQGNPSTHYHTDSFPQSQTNQPTSTTPPQYHHSHTPSQTHNKHLPSLPTKILPSTTRTAFETYPHPSGEAHYPEGFEASGAVGGWLMMQPLGFVARCEHTAPGMREWVKGYLGTFLREGRAP